MSTRVKKHLPLLKWLSVVKPSLAKNVLKVVDKEVLDAICECCYNVLKGNVPLTREQKRSLAKYRKVLRGLSGPGRVSLKKKRQLVQTGGFLPMLAKPVLGALANFLLS